MRGRVLCAIAAAALATAALLPGTAAAQGWVGLGIGAPGWAFYAPAPYFASAIDISYYRYSAYPDGFFIGGSFGGHSLHHGW